MSWSVASAFVRPRPNSVVLHDRVRNKVEKEREFIMKVVQVSFRRFFSCVSFLISFIKNILFRRRQRKSSQTENETLPTSVMVTSGDSAHNQVIKWPCFSIVCYQLGWCLLKHSQTLSWVDEINPTSIFNCVVKKKKTLLWPVHVQ